MAVYVVVHHNRNPHQLWPNSWLDDDRLEAIQTTKEIGNLCMKAKQANEDVFVHRCGWGEYSPIVCCSASVDRVAEIDKNTKLVSFIDQKILNSPPPVSPTLGQNFYLAPSN